MTIILADTGFPGSLQIRPSEVKGVVRLSRIPLVSSVPIMRCRTAVSLSSATGCVPMS
jgi:hypothetical protein